MGPPHFIMPSGIIRKFISTRILSSITLLKRRYGGAGGTTSGSIPIIGIEPIVSRTMGPILPADGHVGERRILAGRGGHARAIGHKGADLLFWQPAHGRIARFVPDIRFIFSLRNPVNRAWSHYWAERAKGRETLGFEAALAAEQKRAEKSDWARYHLSYKARGYYEQSLRRFLKIFACEQILIITLEEKIKRPRETLQKVYGFLDVDPEKGLDMATTRRQQGWATLPRPWTQKTGARMGRT